MDYCEKAKFLLVFLPIVVLLARSCLRSPLARNAPLPNCAGHTDSNKSRPLAEFQTSCLFVSNAGNGNAAGQTSGKETYRCLFAELYVGELGRTGLWPGTLINTPESLTMSAEP